MSDESIQATAENLRADFLNATSTAERWKVLNRAIDYGIGQDTDCDGLKSIRDAYHEWFIDAPTAYKQWKLFLACVEWAMGRAAKRENADHHRQKVQTDEHRCSALADVNGNVVSEGDEVGWGDDEDGWIVRHVYRDGTVIIAPRDSSSPAEEWVVSAQDLWV